MHAYFYLYIRLCLKRICLFFIADEFYIRSGQLRTFNSEQEELDEIVFEEFN